MGRRIALDIEDFLSCVMGEDRPFTKKEIAEDHECCKQSVHRAAHEAMDDGHPVYPTTKGYYYIKQPKNLIHIAAISSTQVWAAGINTATRRIAQNCSKAIGAASQKLLAQYEREQETV